MNIITKAVMAIVAVMALTTMSASAGDNFDGLYAGVTAGYSDFGSGALNANGIEYGVLAGYNVSVFERLVFGFESELTFSDVNFRSIVDVRHSVGVYGRMGYELTNATLLYVKAGYVATNLAALGGSDTLNGIRGGVGVDQFITDSLFVRLEGSYTDFARLGGSESDQYRVTVGLGYKF